MPIIDVRLLPAPNDGVTLKIDTRAIAGEISIVGPLAEKLKTGHTSLLTLHIVTDESPEDES